MYVVKRQSDLLPAYTDPVSSRWWMLFCRSPSAQWTPSAHRVGVPSANCSVLDIASTEMQNNTLRLYTQHNWFTAIMQVNLC